MDDHATDLMGRLRWLAIAAAAAVTLGMGTTVAAHDTDRVPAAHPSVAGRATEDDPYVACLKAGSTNADRMAERAAGCRQRTDDLYLDPAFVACLREAAHTPDALEHWRERCRILTRS